MSHKTDATLRPFLFAFPHNVLKAHVAPKAHRFSRRQKHRIIAYYFVFIIYNYFYYYISKKIFENVCFLLYKTFFIWYYPFITLYYAKLLTR